jgi:hypothetical protein
MPTMSNDKQTLRLDTLPNQIQQIIYSYVFPFEGTCFRDPKCTNLSGWNPVCVLKRVQVNLIAAVGAYGHEREKVLKWLFNENTRELKSNSRASKKSFDATIDAEYQAAGRVRDWLVLAYFDLRLEYCLDKTAFGHNFVKQLCGKSLTELARSLLLS